MKIEDGLKLWGHLQIYRDGELVLDEDNTIVSVGKIEVLNMLTGDSTSHIDRISIGNGNDPNTPADTTDTALANEISIKAFGSTLVDPINRIIEYRATFTSGEFDSTDFDGGPVAEPEVINEAALLLSNDVMFSRRTFKARPFDIIDDIVYTLIWSVGVA